MIERERLEALVARGLSDAQIARLERVDPRTVLRWRGRLGIASQWRTERRARHGTTTRYADGCHCRDCRAANAAAQLRHKRRQNARTAHAPSYGLPWSAEADNELLRGTGTVLDRALRLGRTYSACTQRLEVLRAQDDTRDDPPE